MEPGQDPHEIAANLSQKRHRILVSIRTRGGTAKTSEITTDTDLDSSLVNYHYKRLMEASLIERTDKDRDDPMPREGFTYQITNRGKNVLSAAQEDYGMDPLGGRIVRQRLDDLEARTEKLEQENDQLQEEKTNLENQVNEIEGRLDDMRDANSKLWETVQGLK
ncbi:MarR family transcriptional regulator [Natronococcus sp. A-GB7]|uniref:MarR family transcriptional regulator n=1 Tax=Natronococcus sp. A-GB7 TaxID=3037649 RepID=UPI00241F9C8A|nr:MarR family transcriptional regulator [Natronococcus sp. A-GB7]MDG5821578.1 hypothetical protein [Natronococcus sp. A-GB7]